MRRWKTLLVGLTLSAALLGAAALGEAGRETVIELGEEIAIRGAGAQAAGHTVTISEAGVYTLSGAMEGQVYVNAGGKDIVTLRLNGVALRNDGAAAIYVENAALTEIELAPGTENVLQSGQETALDGGEEDASGGALYARDDLRLSGDGNLTVLGYINNGIQTTNHLTLAGGQITVTARNNGIKGKDAVAMEGGTVTIRSGGDGVKADSTDGEGYGVVEIAGGSLEIEAAGDGIQAETLLTVGGGSLHVNTGGGSENAPQPAPDNGSRGGRRGFPPDRDDTASDSESAKGLKSGGELVISGGVVAVDASDDALHANGSLTVTGGVLTLSSGDDGVHADDTLTISGGTVAVTRSYEGLEGNQIFLTGGDISVVAADDGVNASGGQGMGGFFGWGDSYGGRSGEAQSGDSPNLYIDGATVRIDAGGDGLDSNDNLWMESGDVIVNGPSNSGNGALDYGAESGGRCVVNGGTILALGASGMAESFDASSAQCSFRHDFRSGYAAGDELTLQNESGETIFRYTVQKSGSSVVFSSPALALGQTYTLTVGNQSARITLSDISTRSGESGGRFFR